MCNAVEGTADSSFIVCSVSVVDGEWRRELGGDTFCAGEVRACGDEIVAKVKNDLYDELHRGSEKVIFRDLCDISFYDTIKSPSNPSEVIVAMVKSTINEPSQVYTFTTSSPTPVQISSHASTFSDPAAVTIEIHTPSQDNAVELDGILFAPRLACTNGRPTRPLPTFVQPHGGPYGRITSNFWPDFGVAQILLRGGYAVFLPNYRGGAGHGQKFASPYKMGEHDHDDVVALVQKTIDMGLADKSNLIIGGWSQGGFLTYLSAVRNGTHRLGWSYKGGVAGAGVSDGDAMALTSDVPGFEGAMNGGAPWESAKDSLASRQGSSLWAFKEAADAGRVPPMLLLHGEVDERVPVTQAWGFQRACRGRGIPCQMVTYPRAGHTPRERNQWLDIYRRTLKFCDSHFNT
ncbi:alpha/beta-hydrolase [Myriangium duriaei CBS 260.36]|uniref:Dipeptidyl-peptidase V n=1 Tax=Myriangium duriaei CBS 260.36 TaxID=1168546 RepID=A0A9P4JCQ5_9PEZI|nr:alpha/beta-hydrolase [Myriangium duriaei CBS 260.36]